MTSSEINQLLQQTLEGGDQKILVGAFVGKLVRVSFDPEGYDEWSKSHSLATNLDDDNVRQTHLSVGTIVGIDLHQYRRKPCLRLFTTIQSVAGINIRALFYLSEEDRWFIGFKEPTGEGWSPASVPAIVQLLD